jgi:4-nitrophenyl phosphatase
MMTKPLFKNIKALILDMDGVLWRSDAPIGDLPSTFEAIRRRGLRYVFATNNSTRTPAQYVERLDRLGIPTQPAQVVTSSQAVAIAMLTEFPRGSKVFMVGEEGLRFALLQQGFEILDVDRAAEACAVVMGMDRGINFEKAVEATLLVGRGVPFFATNSDRTFPTPRGEIPGAGAWLSVVTTATGITPIVAGKPFPLLIRSALEVLGTQASETLVVGDRLETDIAAGRASGCPTGLVLSGVSTRAQAESWTPPPELIADDLASLVAFL